VGNTRFDRIRSQALEAMYRKGYDGMTLRDLAREVGIQTPSLYNYITSKQDLLYHLLRSIMEELIDHTQQALAQSKPSPVERLRTGIRAFVQYNAHHPHEAAVSDAEFRSLSLENRDKIIRLRDELQALYYPVIEEGMRDGVFVSSDAGIVTNTILSACARIYVWYHPDGRCSPEELADITATYLVRGLLQAPENHSSET